MQNKRLKIFWKMLRPPVILFLKIMFGYKYQKAENLPEKYIVLSNHATDYDPLFVGASFPEQMYFVASEHISRWKFAFKLINFLLEPIIRYKGTVAASTVMEALRKVKQGSNVAIFAEGARTWDGVTGPIAPATAKLIKSAGCGLVTYKISGGYFVSPRWSTSLRRGPISGAPVHVYTKEQLKGMSTDEIYSAILRDLYEDAYESQLASPKKYRSRRPAERLENYLFICPECAGHDTFRSQKDTVRCQSCGFTFQYDQYGMLKGAPFETVRDFSRWQLERVSEDVANGAVYTAGMAVLTTVSRHQETFVAQGPLSLSAETLKCGDTEIALTDIIDMSIHGKRGIVFSTSKEYYELKPSAEYNANKFCQFFEAYRDSQNKP